MVEGQGKKYILRMDKKLMCTFFPLDHSGQLFIKPKIRDLCVCVCVFVFANFKAESLAIFRQINFLPRNRGLLKLTKVTP